MTKTTSVSETHSKWGQRGFASKHEYIGWLQFNDLVDESFGYDDTYTDPYSGKTIRLGESSTEDVEQYNNLSKLSDQ